MAMCRICKNVRRKAKSESWIDRMCHDCYVITDHFTWKQRWDFVDQNFINYNMS
jgi:hypothetical protein